MARIIYGGVVDEIVGSIGGVTFQRNGSGTIARLKPKTPVNPSQLQSDQQYKLGILVAQWPALSIADKNSWDAFALAHSHTTPWGASKQLNGYQWYLSCNLYLLTIGESIISTAPAFTVVDTIDAFVLTPAAGTLKIVWPGVVSVIPDSIIVSITLPQRQTSLKLRKSLYIIDVTDSFNASEMDITSAFEALTGLNWATFYASANCNLIARLMVVQHLTGLNSQYTSSLASIVNA